MQNHSANIKAAFLAYDSAPSFSKLQVLQVAVATAVKAERNKVGYERKKLENSISDLEGKSPRIVEEAWRRAGTPSRMRDALTVFDAKQRSKDKDIDGLQSAFNFVVEAAKSIRINSRRGKVGAVGRPKGGSKAQIVAEIVHIIEREIEIAKRLKRIEPQSALLLYRLIGDYESEHASKEAVESETPQETEIKYWLGAYNKAVQDRKAGIDSRSAEEKALQELKRLGYFSAKDKQ